LLLRSASPTFCSLFTIISRETQSPDNSNIKSRAAIIVNPRELSLAMDILASWQAAENLTYAFATVGC
jgi:hypothetical protein